MRKTRLSLLCPFLLALGILPTFEAVAQERVVSSVQQVQSNQDTSNLLEQSTQSVEPVTQVAQASGSEVSLTVGSTISLRSINFPSRYVRHENGLAELPEVATVDESALFVVREGLAGGGSISFESVNAPGQYLRHQGFRVKLQSFDESDLFRSDASFIPVGGLAGEGVSFESVNFPGHYLRHCSFSMYIDNNQRGNPACDPSDAIYRGDTSFVTEAAGINSATTTETAGTDSSTTTTATETETATETTAVLAVTPIESGPACRNTNIVPNAHGDVHMLTPDGLAYDY